MRKLKTTFIILGSFQGPRLEERQPPSIRHLQEPPKKSGNCLKRNYIMKRMHCLFFIIDIEKDREVHQTEIIYLESMASSSLP